MIFSILTKFLLGGTAEFTVVSKKTQVKLTFRVHRLPLEKSTTKYAPWFVDYVTPGGTWKFIGTIKAPNGKFWWSKKSKHKFYSEEVQAFLWLWNHKNQDLSDKLQLLIDRCSRCGRTLTTTQSRLRGLGPICYNKPLNNIKL